MKVSFGLCVLGLFLNLISGLPIENSNLTDSNIVHTEGKQAVVKDEEVSAVEHVDEEVSNVEHLDEDNITNATKESIEVADVSNVEEDVKDETEQLDASLIVNNDDSVVTSANTSIVNEEGPITNSAVGDKLGEGENHDGGAANTILDGIINTAKPQQADEDSNVNFTEVNHVDTQMTPEEKESIMEKSHEKEEDNDNKALEDTDDTDVDVVKKAEGGVPVVHSGEPKDIVVNQDEENSVRPAEVETTDKPAANEHIGAENEMNVVGEGNENEEGSMTKEKTTTKGVQVEDGKLTEPVGKHDVNTDETNREVTTVKSNEIEDQSTVDEEDIREVNELSSNDAKHAEHEAKFKKYETYIKKLEARFAVLQAELDSLKAHLAMMSTEKVVEWLKGTANIPANIPANTRFE